MREVEALISRNDHRTNMYLDGLAGDFRGISRGFDGIEENFMDVATPEMRKEYLRLYKLTIRQACNIEKTINNWWKDTRSEENTSELQSRPHLVCRLLLEKKKKKNLK